MKILIVDKDPAVARELASRVAALGVGECHPAGSAEEAVDILHRVKGLDLLVTDVVMEGTDGFTLREAMAGGFPALKTIFMSEYDLSDYADRVGGMPVLAKPVGEEALEAAVRDTVGDVAAAVPVAAPKVAAAAPKAVASTPKVVAASASPVTPAPKVAAVPPVPKAVPAAPKAVPVASNHPMPAPKAVAAVPKASAAPSAAPKAVPMAGNPAVAAPKVAAAAPKAVAAGAKPAAAVREHALPPDELVGTTVGNYAIEAKIDENANGGIYRAVQTNMARKVRFYSLSAANAADPARIKRFLSNASVKANVKHPSVLAVFEAGEGNGTYFYACEFVPSRSLEEIAAAGGKIEPGTALAVLERTADVMAYFGREKIQHNRLKPSLVLLDAKQSPRIANIAAHDPDTTPAVADEMRELAQWLAPIVPDQPHAPAVRGLLGQVGEGSIPSWPALAQAAKEAMPKAAPKDAYKLEARERAAIKSLEEAKKRQQRNMIVTMATSLTLLLLSFVAVWYFIFREPPVKNFNTMIEIPAGEFIYQDGEKVNLPAFWIDEYEVTIGEYAKFLEWAQANPGKLKELEHPDMPAGKSHVPVDWADQDLQGGLMNGYYSRARKWRKYKAAALDVNSPVFALDWFDAYTFAEWKGRRLPTEQEWEKAARGTDGRIYPWGNELDPKLVSSGADRDVDPEKGGDIDGYRAWSPVDAIGGDVSPYGVKGMAGNVSEWTGTWAPHPEFGDKVPVIRGGNWFNPDVDVRRRKVIFLPFDQDVSLGFRTVSDTAPVKKE